MKVGRSYEAHDMRLGVLLLVKCPHLDMDTNITQYSSFPILSSYMSLSLHLQQIQLLAHEPVA